MRPLNNKLLSVLFACFIIMAIAGTSAYLTSCAMSHRSIMERKDQDRGWRPCQDGELGDGVSVVGKLCVRHCLNYGLDSKCNKGQWKVEVKDYCGGDFKFFQNGAFIFLDEDSVL